MSCELRMVNRAAVSGIVAIAIGLSAFSAGAQEKPEKAAQSAAGPWLALVDTDKARESWKAAAELFRKQVTAEQWEASIQAVHAQTGKNLSRKLRSAQYTKTLPNAPDGEYVVLLFDSSFEKARSVTETVVPMKDPDGVWRISGYFVRPAS